MLRMELASLQNMSVRDGSGEILSLQSSRATPSLSAPAVLSAQPTTGFPFYTVRMKSLTQCAHLLKSTLIMWVSSTSYFPQ